MVDIAVRCSDLTKSFGQSIAVNKVNLEIEEASFVALLGPSGCGKTTLLRLIAGFESPDNGTVKVGGIVVSTSGILLPPEKRKVGIVFQDNALFPHLDVGANIAFGLTRKIDRKKQVAEMLSLVGLTGFERRMPYELSGGEQQRVALARALAPAPNVLLLDEPFSNLDADLRARVRVEVKGILACAGATVIFVTHDQEEALFMGDKVGVMNNGQLEQIDTPENIFHRPATPFIAQFVGTADFINGTVRDKVIDTEIGRLTSRVDLPNGINVRVMIRPDFIDIRPVEDGTGVIVERIFQGMHYLYQVRLPSGEMVHSLQHHNREYDVNARVSIKMNPGHRAMFFTGNK